MKKLMVIFALLTSVAFAQEYKSFQFYPRYDSSLTNAVNVANKGLETKYTTTPIMVNTSAKTNANADTSLWLDIPSLTTNDTLLAYFLGVPVGTDTIIGSVQVQYGCKNVVLGSKPVDSINTLYAGAAAVSNTGLRGISKYLWNIKAPGTTQIRLITSLVKGSGAYLATPNKKYIAGLVTRKK